MTQHRRPHGRVSNDIHHNEPGHSKPTNPTSPTHPTKACIVAAAHQSPDHPNPGEDNASDDLDAF